MNDESSCEDRELMFPFDESPRLGVYTTREIANGSRPILLVWHEDDGDWQFLPGDEIDLSEGLVLHLEHILDRYPELRELADLPRGWAAERKTTTSPWRRYRLASA